MNSFKVEAAELFKKWLAEGTRVTPNMFYSEGLELSDLREWVQENTVAFGAHPEDIDNLLLADNPQEMLNWYFETRQICGFPFIYWCDTREMFRLETAPRSKSNSVNEAFVRAFYLKVIE